MKKIMFNDKYGLTQSVLEGRKTQTRRMPSDSIFQRCRSLAFCEKGFTPDWETRCAQLLLLNATYRVGEEVAVAQSYDDICTESLGMCDLDVSVRIKEKGYFNKMFVKAALMPHRIKITNIRVERLQDISDEDCLKEGVIEHKYITPEKHSKIRYYYTCRGIGVQSDKYFEDTIFRTARDAYAALIDKVSGKGTWESNPYVFVYEFELIR